MEEVIRLLFFSLVLINKVLLLAGNTVGAFYAVRRHYMDNFQKEWDTWIQFQD